LRKAAFFCIFLRGFIDKNIKFKGVEVINAGYWRYFPLTFVLRYGSIIVENKKSLQCSWAFGIL